ncbi:MAG: hypothetical protein KIT00_11260 [Rhodospirillales bacterium]|nr:hypothetical protein [Rhodospirillales bacterium]
MGKIFDEIQAQAEALLMAGWLRRDGRDTGDASADEIAAAAAAIKPLHDKAQNDVTTLALGIASTAVMATLNELIRRRLLPEMPVDVQVELISDIPLSVIRHGELEIQDDDGDDDDEEPAAYH